MRIAIVITTIAATTLAVPITKYGGRSVDEAEGQVVGNVQSSFDVESPDGGFQLSVDVPEDELEYDFHFTNEQQRSAEPEPITRNHKSYRSAEPEPITRNHKSYRSAEPEPTVRGARTGSLKRTAEAEANPTVRGARTGSLKRAADS